MKKILSRRTLLRGAGGVALALPWMESLAPRSAGAATGTAPTRYMPIFLPNGASRNWPATGAGIGAAWSLSPMMAPLADLKAKTIALTNLENGSAFNKDGSNSVEPSHGRQPGAWLCCVDAATARTALNVADANGISVDQVMAAHAVFAGKTAMPSLEVGLSTVYSSCDTFPDTGKPCQCSISRSVSWKTPTHPNYKTVDALTAFNMIVTGINAPATTVPDPVAMKRMALRKSVIDSALENAGSTRARLAVGDRMKMDEFLDSVRTAEMRATSVSVGMTGGLACTPIAKPTGATVTPDGIRHTTATYNKGDHADAMNALIVMAFQCDVTRIITYMLEDERSEFVYDHVPRRTWTGNGSTVGSGTCPEYHAGGQHGDPNDYATMTWWNVGKVADLCKKMDAVTEANGKTMLDNTVVFFGGAMHTDDHHCDQLPALLIGGGGGKLKTDQNVVFKSRPVRDLHFTIMNSVFGMAQTNFGQNLTGAPIATITEIVA